MNAYIIFPWTFSTLTLWKDNSQLPSLKNTLKKYNRPKYDAKVRWVSQMYIETPT